MNDGNTALPVSPVSTEDTMRLSAMFSRAAQAIVDASTYPKQIEELKAELTQIRTAYEDKVLHAQELDNQLAEMRNQRNQAEEGKRIAEAEAAQNARDRDRLFETVAEHSKTIEALRADLLQTRKERDEYGLKTLDLEDQVRTWKARAEQGREQLARLADLFKPDPEPVPEPEPVPAPSPQEYETKPYSEPDHYPPQEPSPAPRYEDQPTKPYGW